MFIIFPIRVHLGNIEITQYRIINTQSIYRIHIIGTFFFISQLVKSQGSSYWDPIIFFLTVALQHMLSMSVGPTESFSSLSLRWAKKYT